MATAEFEYPVAEWFTGDYSAIPERMQDALKRYVIDRVKPGGFLRAIICNDLRAAVGKADDENLPLIALYVQWFYNRAPAACHGSPRAFMEWVDCVEDVRREVEHRFGVDSRTADAIVDYCATLQRWAQADK